MRESEALHRSILENIDLSVTLLDMERNIITSNATRTGSVVRGGHGSAARCYEIIRKREKPCERCPAERVLRTGQPVECEETIHDPERGVRHIRAKVLPILDDAQKPTGLVELLEDITERKKTERTQQKLEVQMREAQRLESLGVLAGGIAHDFNNILMGIMGNNDLVRQTLGENTPVERYLNGIEASSRRAAELCRQMLAYAGKGQMEICALDLSHGVLQTRQLLEASIAKTVSLRLDLADNLPMVEVDPAQFRQVLMAFAVNSAEALGDKPGEIHIRTGVERRQNSDPRLSPGTAVLAEGSYVILEVRDNGPGMNEETRSKVFDPFFTTKFPGRGLGLAAAAGIARAHGGGIEVESREGEGSTFRFLLPVSGVPAETAPLREQEAKEAGPPPARFPARILLVDDEMVVREVAREMLERCGYKVVTAGDGQQALDIFLGQDGGFEAVILDMAMPRMDGAEAFRRMHDIHPQVPVLISSGFDEAQAAERFAGLQPAGFLHKPYTLNELDARLRGALRCTSVSDET